MPEPIHAGPTEDLFPNSLRTGESNVWDSVRKVLEDPERRETMIFRAQQSMRIIQSLSAKETGSSAGDLNPPGVSVQTTPGESAVFDYGFPDKEYRPLGARSGTPFAVCLRNGTYVAGDVSGKGGPPSLEAVRGAARGAFRDRASFTPLNGGDMTQVQEGLSQTLKDPEAKLSGVMAIQNDPRCTPSGP